MNDGEKLENRRRDYELNKEKKRKQARDWYHAKKKARFLNG
jgi:hypothetical protein